jgi:hypothetical protein
MKKRGITPPLCGPKWTLHRFAVDDEDTDQIFGLDADPLFLGPLGLQSLKEFDEVFDDVFLAFGLLVLDLGGIGQLGQHESGVLTFTLLDDPSHEIILHGGELAFGVVEHNDVLPLGLGTCFGSTVLFFLFGSLGKVLENFLNFDWLNLLFQKNGLYVFEIYFHIFDWDVY